jgi:tetratricopeptide (TPR) repeat protein
VVGAIATGIAVLRGRSADKPTLDANLVAVAPFDVLAPGMELWREGLVDVLSRSLDGAGALRTVSPALVVRGWSGRADRTSAESLARRSGAGLVLIGSVLPAGRDSVRLTATVLDAAGNRPVADVDVRDRADRMDRIADSATIRLLRQLAPRAGGAAARSGLGSTSLPAIKEFLLAEQYYRRARWDSAMASAHRAVDLDSTFAPAIRRLGWATAWHSYDAGAAAPYLLRAASLNHGLAPRDSLLLAIDSMFQLGFFGQQRVRRTIEEAVARYPDDPEIWYMMGEARTHQVSALGIPPDAQIEAFERSLALDPGFAPSVFHLIGIYGALGDMKSVMTLIRRAAVHAPGDQLFALLGTLAESRLDSAALVRHLDSIPVNVLYGAHGITWVWRDSAESAVQLARALAGRREARRDSQSSPGPQDLLLLSLEIRGHLREVHAALGDDAIGLMSVFRMLSREKVAGYHRAAVAGATAGTTTLQWLAEAGDTAALQRLLRAADSAAKAGVPDREEDASWAQAFLALSRRDSAAALARMLAIPDSLCGCRPMALLARGRLIRSLRGAEAAFDALRFATISSNPMTAITVVALLERAELAEQLGRRDDARRDYAFVRDIWRRADPELQPYVMRAREGLRRVTPASEQP